MTLSQVLTFEGELETDELSYFANMQALINGGTAWAFQGSYGRSMMDAISSGHCMLGESPARDYYGNRIPSRHEVQEGTKGSRQFVVDAMGEDWAEHMEAA